jgi:hypothetical protein
MKNALLIVSGLSLGLLAALATKADLGLPAYAQAGPGGGAGAGNGTTIVATGGGTQNQNDLCWVLAKVKPVKGPERMVLALYRAERQGESFNLKDVRAIDADLRLIELDAKKHVPDVPSVLRFLPKEEQEALRPTQP